MINRTAAAFLLAVIVSVAALPVSAAEPAPVANADDALTTWPAAGVKAPDFTLATLDNQKLRLADAASTGPVVLVFLRGWVGYQCPACDRQVGDLIANAGEFSERNARVLLVYPGPAEGLKDHAAEFISGKGLPGHFAFVTDPQMRAVSAYKLRWIAPRETAYPATFVIGPDRVVRHAKVSTTHGGRASAKEILGALDRLPAAAARP